MALFSFSDIKFTPTNRRFSSNRNLTSNSGYDTNIMRYPSDIGDANKGHYMIIHVNEQIKTKFSQSLPSSDLPTIFSNRMRTGETSAVGIAVPAITNLIKSGTELLDRFTGGNVGDVVQQGVNSISQFSAAQQSLNRTRTIRRTKETIALYMPDTLAFTQSQGYDALSTTGLGAAAITSVASIFDQIKSSGVTPELLRNITPFIANAIQGDNLLRAAFATATGQVVNPMLEMLYTSPELRQFKFDFMFYPRSKQEAEQVLDIINQLTFHQAPELDINSQSFFLLPPSEFDIKFYCNGVENPNIPKISTCVLTNIDVDYAPNGWSAYEMNNVNTPTYGGTGMPVGMRMSLDFRETEIITKNLLHPGTVSLGTNTVLTEQQRMLAAQVEGFD